MDFHEQALEFLQSRNRHVQLLRKASELLLSISIFSLLLSFFTGLSFIHSYTYYFSTFLLPLFTQIFERKYMFLICNGILVFLVGKSGFSGSSSPPSRVDQQVAADNTGGKIIIRDNDEGIIMEEEATTYFETVGSNLYTVPSNIGVQGNKLLEEEKQEEGEQKEENSEALAEEEDLEKVAEDVDFAEDQGEEEENEEEYGSMGVGERGGGENDTESEGPASNTEELNKKIEEFIRRMKEELKLEAQQQELIVA